MKIYYFCPDLDTPSGGMRRLYRHVEILARNGFPAVILHTAEPFRMSWFASDAPVKYLSSGQAPQPDDILVIPEVCHDAIRSSEIQVRHRVAMVLNWAYVYLGLRPGETYQSFGIHHVISGCEYIREFLSTTMGIASTVVTAGIDTNLFRTADVKELAIVAMPRKNQNYLHTIECIFRCRYPAFASIPFIRLHEVEHTAVAARLSTAAIFLATGFPEGIARPVLEAMSSGCVVVGFAGTGGLEYMRHLENCYLAGDGDPSRAAQLLGEAVSRWYLGEQGAMQVAARNTALCYSNEVEETAVLSYWRNFLETM